MSFHVGSRQANFSCSPVSYILSAAPGNVCERVFLDCVQATEVTDLEEKTSRIDLFPSNCTVNLKLFCSKTSLRIETYCCVKRRQPLDLYQTQMF